MIGMPRITFTTAFAVPESRGTPETRINAQTSPSAVDSASEPTVTMTVSRRPCIRIGRNSADCLRKLFMSVRWRGSRATPVRGRSVLQAPFRQDLLERAVGFDLGERGVDFLQELLVGLAHADPDR